jgi:hypothetical protein
MLAVVGEVISFMVLPDSFAQRGMRGTGCCGGWGPGSKYNMMYNPKTVENVSGEVISVDKITPMKGMSYVMHLTLKTDKEMMSVHLGPGWYIENQDVEIEPGDKIEVRGARITYQGKPAIIAAEVVKGDEILKLRDENGFPSLGWLEKTLIKARCRQKNLGSHSVAEGSKL